MAASLPVAFMESRISFVITCGLFGAQWFIRSRLDASCWRSVPSGRDRGTSQRRAIFVCDAQLCLDAGLAPCCAALRRSARITNLSAVERSYILASSRAGCLSRRVHFCWLTSSKSGAAVDLPRLAGFHPLSMTLFFVSVTCNVARAYHVELDSDKSIAGQQFA